MFILNLFFSIVAFIYIDIELISLEQIENTNFSYHSFFIFLNYLQNN